LAVNSESLRNFNSACRFHRAKVDYSSHPTEHSFMSESFSSRLSPLVLPDADGNRVRLGSLWADHPAVIVFLRHYG
jgi:hypothetical protein